MGKRFCVRCDKVRCLSLPYMSILQSFSHIYFVSGIHLEVRRNVSIAYWVQKVTWGMTRCLNRDGLGAGNQLQRVAEDIERTYSTHTKARYASSIVILFPQDTFLPTLVNCMQRQNYIFISSCHAAQCPIQHISPLLQQDQPRGEHPSGKCHCSTKPFTKGAKAGK